MAAPQGIYADLGGFAASAGLREPFLLRHGLVGHPLLAVEALLELSRRLPADQVEYNAGDIPAHIDRRTVPRTGLSVAETIRRIEECRSWMALKNVERDPEYRVLVDAVLDEVQAGSLRTLPGLHARQAFIFLSSPEAVTPLHMDPEHNVLHQIRGSKIVHLWDPRREANLSDEELERFYTTDDHRGFTLRRLEGPDGEFALGPGDALHFPYEAPHWVKNGPEVSVSFSTTWQSAWSRRKASIHRFNARLRRLGLRPRPFGTSPARDSVKAGTLAALRGARRLLGAGDETPRRTY
jgi:hypothetical protein